MGATVSSSCQASQGRIGVTENHKGNDNDNDNDNSNDNNNYDNNDIINEQLLTEAE